MLLCLLAVVPHAPAARGNASAAAGLSDSTVEAGERTQFRISVTNGDSDDPPPAPVVEGLTIKYAGASHSSQFNLNNGSLSQSSTTTYVYSVKSTKSGRFTIPGQEVNANGAVLRTLPVTLTVIDGGTQTPQAFVELIVPRKSAYIGESIPIEIRACYAANGRHDPAQDLILSGDGFSSQKFTAPRSAPQTVQGTRYIADVYKSAIAGLKIGPLSVGPATVETMVQFPRTRRAARGGGGYYDPYDVLQSEPFDPFNMAPPEEVKLDSQPVAIEIKPLPEEGKPAIFSGAIGQFRLEAEAVPSKAQTGDPVTIRLRLSGQGNFDRIAPPVLADDKGLRTYPPTSKFKADDEVNLSGVKTFEQVVIAEGARTSLPSYRFNYFDPATGRYVSTETPPLAVKIEGGNLATPTPAPSSSSAPASATPTPPVAPTPRRAPEDIHYILAEPGPLRDAGAFRPVYQRPFFWEVQGGILAGVLAFAAAAGWRARRQDAANQRAARLARQQDDLQRALRREDTGRREFYTAAARLAQLRVGAGAGQSSTGLSAADIARMKGLDDRTAGSVREIFDRHEELAYSGGAAAETLVPSEERQDVLATLANIGRH